MVTYKVQIPEDQKSFFETLIEQLGFEADEENYITSEIKSMLDNRLAEPTTSYTPARQALKKIQSKYGL